MTAMSYRIEVKVSSALLIESDVFQMGVGFERRLLRSAAGAECEVGDAVNS